MSTRLIIVRRRGLGFGSVASIVSTMRETHPNVSAEQWRTWRDESPIFSEGQNVVWLRWGCSTTVPRHGDDRVLNQASAIHRVNNKGEFAQTLSEQGLGPTVITPGSIVPNGQYVVRPNNHSRGQNFHLFTDPPSIPEGHYARPLIKKSAEYRVYVMFGKVAAVARKFVDDENAVAWNHALGAHFENVRWDNWPLKVCSRAVHAAHLSGLDYAAVDMMVEGETLTPWVIEINSAGSLPRNEDRTPSYRARCVAKALGWHLDRQDYEHFDHSEYRGWRDAIHPGVWKNHSLNNMEEGRIEFRSVRSGT